MRSTCLVQLGSYLTSILVVIEMNTRCILSTSSAQKWRHRNAKFGGHCRKVLSFSSKLCFFGVFSSSNLPS